MPSILTTLVSVAAAGLTIILIGGALIELSLWSAAYAFMLALTIRDWWRWRSSPNMTPREVADRFMPHLLLFAIGAALPAMNAVESWLGW
jgi:O-antigen/teichoic acid export membrane protein